jgi:hypothetical protein
MKYKNLIHILFVVLICSSHDHLRSQEYVPFPEDSAVWYSVYSWPDPFPPYVYYQTVRYSTIGDTVLNKVVYNKFYLGPSDGSSFVYQGAYRVDSDSNRVYYLDKSQDVERLVYDYTLNPGDTLHSGISFICLDTGRMLMLNGDTLKYQTMLVPDFDNCYQIWVEGIGSLGVPLLEPYWGCAYTYEMAYNLSCFFYKENHVYEWGENPYFTGCIGTNVQVPEHDTQDYLFIYPNPIINTSFIKTSMPSSLKIDYKILDLNGRVWISESNVTYMDIIINGQELCNGIYILSIYCFENKTMQNIKFIVHKN